MKKLLLLAAGALLSASAMNAQDAIYLIGNFQENGDWHIDSKEFTLPGEDGVYEATFNIPEFAGGKWFRFYSEVAETADGWDSVAPYSIGASVNDLNVVFEDGVFSGTILQEGNQNCWVLNNWGGGEITFEVNLNDNTFKFSSEGTSVEPEPSDGSVIYVVGNVVDGGWNINNNSMPLEQVEDGVYSATYNIDAMYGNDAPTFRFYTQLGDWENNSIGSQVPDEHIAIEFTDGVYEGECVEGKGSWELSNWEGGWMALTVDLNNMTVTFEAAEEPGEVEPGPGPEVTTIYVIGDNVNGENWALGTNPMTYNDADGVYTWTGTLGSGFKFNDGTWSGEYNIGAASDDEVLVIGEAFTVVNDGSSKNINFEGDAIEGAVVVLDLEALTVTVTSGAGVHTAIIDLNAPAEYYNLNGVKVSNPVKGGVYVVKQGNQTRKMVIR